MTQRQMYKKRKMHHPATKPGRIARYFNSFLNIKKGGATLPQSVFISLKRISNKAVVK